MSKFFLHSLIVRSFGGKSFAEVNGRRHILRSGWPQCCLRKCVKPLCLLVGLLFTQIAAVAQQGSVASGKPMMLCYVMEGDSAHAPRARIAVESSFQTVLPTVHTMPAIEGFSYKKDESNDGEGNGSVAISIFSEPMSYSAHTMISQITRDEREKFCFNNLLEGTVYDFKRSNRLRIDTGMPPNNTVQNDWRYEEPFCMAFFLRFKL